MEKVAVIGVGYVGLPLALYLDSMGFDVVGVDIDHEKIERLCCGELVYTKNEPGVKELFDTNGVRWVSSYDVVGECDVVLVCVPTPAGMDHLPDYTYLNNAIYELAVVLKKGALVVIESTVAPGETRGVAGMLPDYVHVGCCPERVMPGKMLKNLKSMPRVLGADDNDTADLMMVFYDAFVYGVLDVVDTVTAETVKAAENTYRDVEIAFVNQLAMLCDNMHVDVWKVRELINSVHGRNVLYPGGGVGGHCIPKDPWLLLNGSRSRLIESAREVNNYMPVYVAMLAVNEIVKTGGNRALILGLAYAPNSDDTRNSPTEMLVDALSGFNISCVVHDPFVEGHGGDVYELVKSADIVILMTAHTEYFELDFEKLQPLIDARGVAPVYARRVGDGRRS